MPSEGPTVVTAIISMTPEDYGQFCKFLLKYRSLLNSTKAIGLPNCEFVGGLTAFSGI
jgi:hypothetical protein